MNDEGGIPDRFRHKFPDLRPVKRVPPLTTVNGIGLRLYGRRDADAETNTYVKTHCFCLLYVPLFALGAYRVADAERGWYFIGKERLSSFAKSCNLGVLCLSLLSAAILVEHGYKTSPDYRAQQELQQADAALKSGNALEAARVYRDVAAGSARVDEAKRGLRVALEQGLTNASAQNVVAAFRLVSSMPPRVNSPAPVIPDVYDRGLGAIERFRSKDPEVALGILRSIAPGSGTNALLRATEIELLKAIITANPSDTNRVVELALVYERAHQLTNCYPLLAPYRDRLGSTEGARILGQHLLEEGRYEESYGLLYPYVHARLEQLRAVERSYTNTLARLYEREIEELNAGRADRAFYDAYEKASKAEKAALVGSYTRKRMESDPALKRALAELASAGKIVHVTLDLGTVQLTRAQNLADPAARKAELEAAERTFLSIRGLAGDTDEYRLFLGQVDYWLGKSREGQELFDQLLEANHRSFPILMQLSEITRLVGDHDQARALAEEAYNTSKTDPQKFAAATQRALVQKDPEDHLAWLEKADPNEPTTRISLNNARGEKALKDRNMAAAAEYLRKAVDGYASLPVNSSSLNNQGLACLSLYQASGNIEDHNRGLALLERAVALEPGNSILLINTMHNLFSRAIMDVVQDSIRFDQLREEPDTSLLAHLYRDEQGEKEVYQRLRQDESMKKGLAYLDKALLLAPKSLDLYRAALHFRLGFEEPDEMQKLQQKFRTARMELSELRKQERERDARRPERDKQVVEQCQARIRLLESLLAVPAVKEHPLTLEYVRVALVGTKATAALYGAPADSARILEEAELVGGERASASGVFTLISAVFFRAQDELTRQNPEFAALASAGSKLPPKYLIALALDRGGAVAEAVRTNANVVRAVALEKQARGNFPSFPRAETWVLIRHSDPAEAGRLAERLKTNELVRLSRALEYELNPMSGAAVLSEYWMLKLMGDDTGAVKIYQQALEEGVPLPGL